MKSLSRSEKGLFVGSGAAIALFLGGAWLYNGSRTPEIPAPLAMPRPNGFDLYVAAAQAIVPANPPVDEINDRNARSLSPQQRAARYSPARRRAWIGANARAWALFQPARKAESRHPNTRANPLVGPPYGILRELARCKNIQTKDFKSLNQWNLALGNGLDVMEMGHDIERGAPLIGSLVGIAVQAIGADSIKDVPPRLNALEARNGARRLENLLRNGEKPADVLREEKWTTLAQISNSNSPIPTLLQGPVKHSTSATLNTFIREANKPIGLQKVPPKPSGWNAYLSFTAYDFPLKYNFNVARRNATSQQLLLRLALRAYRLETSAYPTNLSQLAPKYLKQIPVDPFGRGETWRYRRSGNSYLVWSIGPDGRDDRGVSIPKRPKSKRVFISDDSVGDWVAKP